jgi:hypothetical protein
MAPRSPRTCGGKSQQPVGTSTPAQRRHAQAGSASCAAAAPQLAGGQPAAPWSALPACGGAATVRARVARPTSRAAAQKAGWS